MQERVSTIEGNKPVLIIAPHAAGHDDDNTGIIAEKFAEKIDGYAVINWGWRRANAVNHIASQANCNNVDHCHEDVVKDEFLDPILRYSTRITNSHPYLDVYIIHGVGNEVRGRTNEPILDVIVGYGEGSPSSITCSVGRREAFMYTLTQAGMGVFQGKAGGQYTGRAKANLNQLWRLWYPHTAVSSLQIEIIKELRADETMAQIAGEALAEVYLKYKKFYISGDYKTDIDFAKYRKTIVGV